jgi:hypothetical protein
MHKFLIIFLALAACQTAQQRSEKLVAKRMAQLKPLSSWRPLWCQVDTELTEPAKARYEEMFPSESASDLSYVWRSRESSCEITPMKPSAIAKSQQAFLETALCLLMQVHYVNSPFDELAVAEIEPQGELTHIRTGANSELGIFLPPDLPTVETRTKSRGVLRAEYAGQGGMMVPKRLEQRLHETSFVIDDIVYDTSGAKPLLKSFWIEVGAEKPLRHSQAFFRDCRPL